MRNRIILSLLLLSFLQGCRSSASLPDDYVPLPPGVSVTTLRYATKDGQDLFLDVYRDTTVQGKLPAFVYSFGGGWTSGVRTDAKWIGRFAKNGMVGVCIDYRLGLANNKVADSLEFGPKYTSAIRMAVEDLYDATSFLISKTDELGIDPQKLILSGGSAGATNSVMAEYWLCNDDPMALERLPEGFRYAGVVPFAGGVWKMGTDKPVWKKAPCPFLFVHGEKDQLVPIGEVLMPECDFGAFGPDVLIAQFKENGYPYESLIVKEADHFLAGAPDYSIQTPKVKIDYTNHVFDFIDRVILGGQKLQLDYTEKDFDRIRDLKWYIGQMVKAKATGKFNSGPLPAYGGYDRVGMETETVEYAVKEGESLKMDIYWDPSVPYRGKRPVFIYSFGGGWEGGSRKDGIGAMSPFLDRMTKEGYVMVGIDYRLGYMAARKSGAVEDISLTTHLIRGTADDTVVQDAVMRAMGNAVEDLYDATSYIVNNAERWNADPSCIVIGGGSAGAINSLTAEYWRANAHPLAKSHLPKDFRYAGVVSCAGAIWHMTEEPVAWKSAPCPVLFFHGDKDRLIPYNELILPESGVTLTGPEQLVTAFETGKWPFMFYTVKEGDHLIANIPTGECNEIITAFVNRLCVNMEQVGIRIQEASLDSPHNYMWFFTERLGYSADLVRDIFGKVVENQ